MKKEDLKEISQYLFRDSLEFRYEGLLQKVQAYLGKKYPEVKITLDISERIFRLENYNEEDKNAILEELNSLGLVINKSL